MGDEIYVYDDALVYKLGDALHERMKEMRQARADQAKLGKRKRDARFASMYGGSGMVTIPGVTEIGSGSSVLHAYMRQCVRVCSRPRDPKHDKQPYCPWLVSR